MTTIKSAPDAQFVDLLRSHLKYLKPGAELDFEQQLKPLGLDSMAAVDLLFDIEDSYGVILSDRYLTEATFSTAGALWMVISQLKNGVETEG